MSGGSFDYLYLKLDHFYMDDVEDIYHDLKSMSEWLTENGKVDVANEMIDLCEKLLVVSEDVYKIIDSFPTGIIKDAEWWCSGDIGEESFDKRVQEHRLSAGVSE